jgi:hypothetical protein
MEIIDDDMPFLMDSVLAAIAALTQATQSLVAAAKTTGCGTGALASAATAGSERIPCWTTRQQANPQ